MSIYMTQEARSPKAGAVRRSRWYFDALWQLFVATCGYIVYSVSVGAVNWLGATKAREQLAFQNAHHVIDLERAARLFSEQRLQALIVRSDFWMQVFNAVYMWAHLPLIIMLAIWLYVRHRAHFRLIRNAVLISGAIGLFVFQVFPVAPPRLLPDLHFVDTAARVSGVYDTVEPKVFFNPYAAVPSMHVGWVLLMGLSVWWWAGERRFALLGLTVPAFMAFAVIVTGNHYYVDVVTGALTALVGLALAYSAERWIYRGESNVAKAASTRAYASHQARHEKEAADVLSHSGPA